MTALEFFHANERQGRAYLHDGSWLARVRGMNPDNGEAEVWLLRCVDRPADPVQRRVGDTEEIIEPFGPRVRRCGDDFEPE